MSKHIHFYIFLCAVFATVSLKRFILHMLSFFLFPHYGTFKKKGNYYLAARLLVSGLGGERSCFPWNRFMWSTLKSSKKIGVHMNKKSDFNNIFCFIPSNQKQGHYPPWRIIASRSFLTVGGRVSGSLLTAHPRFTVLDVGGGCVC